MHFTKNDLTGKYIYTIAFIRMIYTISFQQKKIFFLFSIYGARHLAAKLDKESYSHQNVVGKSIERMDIFVLLDLLGAKDPQIFSIQKPTDVS